MGLAVGVPPAERLANDLAPQLTAQTAALAALSTALQEVDAGALARVEAADNAEITARAEARRHAIAVLPSWPTGS